MKMIALSLSLISLAACQARSNASQVETSNAATVIKKLDPTHSSSSIQAILYKSLDVLSKNPANNVTVRGNTRIFESKSSKEKMECTRESGGEALALSYSCALTLKSVVMKATKDSASIPAVLYKILDARASSDEAEDLTPVVIKDGSVRTIKVDNKANRNEVLICDSSSGTGQLTVQKYSCEFKVIAHKQ